MSDDICAETNPCKHGKCQNTFNDFQCKCNFGWMGDLCNIRNYCNSSDNPCSKESDCININGGYVCKIFYYYFFVFLKTNFYLGVSPVTFTKTSIANFAMHLPPHYLSPMKQTNMTFEIRTRSVSASLLKLVNF